MGQQQQAISLVIFDFDGVIVDSEVISKSVLTRLLLDRGVQLTDAYYFRHFLGHSYAHCCKKVLEDFDLVIGDEFLQIYQSELKSAFARDLTVTPGLIAMLEALGVNCCIATSSTPERVANALKTVGLADFFTDNVYTASQVQHGKPAPDLFLFAADKQQVEPQHCLVIEDSNAGITAALAANMRVIHYLGGSHLTQVAVPEQTGVVPCQHWQQLFELVPSIKQH